MQFIKLKEISRRIYLLYCTFTLFLLAEGRKHLTNVKVGIFLDRILHSETSFGNYTQELADFYHNTTLTKISLETQTIQLNGLPFEDISRRFCVDIVQNNISVIVLQTRNLELTQFVGHLASFFKIPAIESVSREPLLSDKEYFSTLVRNVPSEVLQFTVFLDFLKFAWRRRAYVIVSDDMSYGLALQYYHENDFADITIINLGSPNVEEGEIIKHLLKIKSSTAHAVYLYCDSKLAHFILWIAKDFRLINDEMLWIISERSLENILGFYTLPSFIYVIRTRRFSQSEEKFDRTQLIHSLSVIQRTFESMNDTEVHQYLRTPLDCYSSIAWEKGMELHKLLEASVNSRDSNQMEHKTKNVHPSYEILYLQTPYKQEEGWVQIGIWTSKGLTLQLYELDQETPDKKIGEIPRLLAAVVEYPPLTMKADFDESEGCYQGLECKKYTENSQNFTRYCCYGLAIDVLRYVKTELQFEPLIYFVRDGNYGAKNSSADTWNGVVRDVLEGKADIAIDLMTNEARSEVIDFSLRWTHAGLALLVLVGEQKVEDLDFSFFRPFTIYLWMGMIGVVNFYLGLLWFTDRLSPYGHRKSFRARNHNGFDLSESMWYCWGVCFDNQFVDSRPRSLSARAMAVFLAIFALMCVTSYTANLTAHLLSDDTKPEVTGIRDPKITDPDSKITYGVVKSSYVDSYFELNEDPIMQSMFRRMRDKNHLVNNFTDGVERVRNRKLDIFISEVLSLDYEVAKQKSPSYPRLQVVGAAKPFAESGYSYAFKKNSPWKPKFDLVINRMKAENVPSELYKKWVSSGEDRSEEHHQRLNVYSLSGVFFLGASLALVAILFLSLENRLFAAGFIYQDMKGDNFHEKGTRKYSGAVKRKLLDFNTNKDEAEFPDISDYLRNRRRSNLILKTLYNPKSIKRKYEEAGENGTAPTSV